MNKRKVKNKRHQIHLAKKGQRKKKQHSSVEVNKSRNSSHLGDQYRIVSIKDATTGSTVSIRQLLEYSLLYPGKKIDLHEEIRNYSRNTILKMALVLEKNYGLYQLSDLEAKPFFSYDSDLLQDRMRRISQLLQKSGISPDLVSYACERTILELLKLAFSVPVNDCGDKYDDLVSEVKLFDLLLAINEQKITVYSPGRNGPPRLDQLMYAGLYGANEFTNYDARLLLAEQMYYAQTFFEFITSRRDYEDFYQCFLNIFQIDHWKVFYKSVVLLAVQTILEGLGTFNLERNDPNKLINQNVLSRISINENETIAYEENTDLNRDFVRFRSHPVIEMSNGDYMLFNQKLMIERLYNGIYFDLLTCQNELKYNGKTYNQFFKEIFVEKYLFDKTMLTCIADNRIDTCLPSRSLIEQTDYVDRKEDVDQPDFYIREGNSLFIFECKAVKLNGDLKSSVDNDTIIDELKNKLLLKRWKISSGEKRNLANPKPEGVGQLTNHILKLEANTFKWEQSRPDDPVYYPILVLESDELMQLSLSALLNEWYDELLDTNQMINKKRCQPVIVLTIKTLFLYSDLFYENGFKYYIDSFISDCLKTGKEKISMSTLENFDNWMTSNYHCNKNAYFYEIIKNLNN